jgi:hypothetical protein
MLRGAPWFSVATEKPKDWQPFQQLERLIQLEKIQLSAITSKEDNTQRTEIEFVRVA